MLVQSFKIRVNDQEYNVTPGIGVHAAFKIETNCEYLFTIHSTAEEYWEITDYHVKPLHDDLIQEIGMAIEEYIYSLSQRDEAGR